MHSPVGYNSIYGHLPNKSDIILALGTHDNITSLLTHVDHNLQFTPLMEANLEDVAQFTLTYESPIISSIHNTYFSLMHKPNNKQVNVKIAVANDHLVASATLSADKTIFSIEHSNIDKFSRALLLAGAIYALKTNIGEKSYVVSWYQNSGNTVESVIILPIMWYEDINGICVYKSGLTSLLDSIAQNKFKGYTSNKWCELLPTVEYCDGSNTCGACLGICADDNLLCYPSANLIGSQATYSEPFVCGNREKEFSLLDHSNIASSNTPSTTGTNATWIAVIAIFIIVIVLAWGLFIKYRPDH